MSFAALETAETVEIELTGDPSLWGTRMRKMRNGLGHSPRKPYRCRGRSSAHRQPIVSFRLKSGRRSRFRPGPGADRSGTQEGELAGEPAHGVAQFGDVGSVAQDIARHAGDDVAGGAAED